VVLLQAMLRQRGYNISFNGLFDNKTRAAFSSNETTG
jgi:hypothetical protein